MSIVEIGVWQLAAAYLLLAFPLAIMLWYRIPMIGDTAVALVRMTVQLIFVGLYLQVIFQLGDFPTQHPLAQRRLAPGDGHGRGCLDRTLVLAASASHRAAAVCGPGGRHHDPATALRRPDPAPAQPDGRPVRHSHRRHDPRQLPPRRHRRHPHLLRRNPHG